MNSFKLHILLTPQFKGSIMILNHFLPVFTGKNTKERQSPEELMSKVRQRREKSPGMDALYEIVDGVLVDKAKDWNFKLDSKTGDTLSCSISGKEYSLKRVKSADGRDLFFVDTETKDHKKVSYPVAKRAYSKVLDKIKRFINVKALSNDSLRAIRFKLHINPETHKRQLPEEHNLTGVSTGVLHKQMRAKSPSYDPGKENINNLMEGLAKNKARIIVFKEGKLAQCLLNQIHYKLEAKDGNYFLSVNTFGKEPFVFALSKRIFNQAMKEVSQATK